MIAVQCIHHLPQLPQKSNKTTSTQQQQFLVPNSRFLSNRNRTSSSSIVSNTPKLPNSRVVSALISEEKVVESSSLGCDTFKLTYLEVNGWIWEVGGVKILVDPLLVGSLDFGMPMVFDASKKYLKNYQLDDLPRIDCLLITQSLDDHCHLKTLVPLSKKFPNLNVIATSDAKPLLDPIFTNVIYLQPGQNSKIRTCNNSYVTIRATARPVGLPLQPRENGYIVISPNEELCLYFNPHCIYDKKTIEMEKADIIITPVIKQIVMSYTMVSGQEDVVHLAKLLNSKFVVPMNNGDLDMKGVLAKLVKPHGTIESFKELLLMELPDVKTLEPVPGVPLQIP